MVRERLEDAQLRRQSTSTQIAEKQAAEKNTPESNELVKRMKIELNSLEIDIYRSRSERYPNNAGLKYRTGAAAEKGRPVQRGHQVFQKAARRRQTQGQVHMELGECFQQIKQYKLAMDNYEAPLEAAVDREIDERKLALYRAGKLALGLGEKYTAAKDHASQRDVARAEKYLNELAGLEFGYKDMPQLLDKIAKIGHKG